jgi:hypothetical protein
MNGLLKHAVEGKIGKPGVMGRRGRRRKQLPDLKETRKYWKLKDEAPERTEEKSLWKRLWTCRKTDYEING